MKALSFCSILLVAGAVFAAPPAGEDVGNDGEATPEVAAGSPTILDEMPEFPPPSPAEWGLSEGGVIIQMIKAPVPLAPFNPFAPTQAGFGLQNISLDTTSNRPMGIRLLRLPL